MENIKKMWNLIIDYFSDNDKTITIFSGFIILLVAVILCLFQYPVGCLLILVIVGIIFLFYSEKERILKISFWLLNIELKESLHKIEITEKNNLEFRTFTQINNIWQQVENECKALLLSKKGESVNNFKSLGIRIKKYGLIDEKHEKILDELRNFRNIAKKAKNYTIISEIVDEYRNKSDCFIEYLKTLN